MSDTIEHYDLICEEINRHLEDSEVAKLSHFAAAATYEKRHRYLVGSATVLSILLTWLLTAPLEKYISPQAATNATGTITLLLALGVSLLTGIGTWLNFNDLALRHRMAAQNYHGLWRNCRNWKTDYPSATNINEAAQTVRAYRDRLTEINRDSPQIPRWAWMTVSRQRAEGSTTYAAEQDC